MNADGRDLDGARTLLSQVNTLRRHCDLDLLLFFSRHPQSLISREQIARLLGYQLDETSRSLDDLLAAGVLTRTERQTRQAQMYVLSTDPAHEGPIAAIVELASSREGRAALRHAIELDGKPPRPDGQNEERR